MVLSVTVTCNVSKIEKNKFDATCIELKNVEKMFMY